MRIQGAHPRKEDLAKKDCSDWAICSSNTEEKVITEALLCLIKDIQLDDQMEGFDNMEEKAAGDFPKNILCSLEDTSNPYPLNKVISSDNHEDKRIGIGLQDATCITPKNTWGERKVEHCLPGTPITIHLVQNMMNDVTKLDLPKYDATSDTSTLQGFHNQSIMKDVNLDLPNGLLEECATTSVPSLDVVRDAAFRQFNANAVSAETNVTTVCNSSQKENIKKHVNLNRILQDIQGKQYLRERGDFKRTDRGGKGFKGNKSEHIHYQQTVGNGNSALRSSNILCGSRISSHLSKHIAKDANPFSENKDLLCQKIKKTIHSAIEESESLNLDKIKHSEEYGSMLLRERNVSGESSEVPYSIRNGSNATNAIVGKRFVQHPYKGGYYDMEHAWERFLSSGSIVAQDMAKQMDGKCLESMGNTGNQCPKRVDDINGIQATSSVLLTDDLKGKLIPTDFSKIVTGPPWVSLSDLSMLLSATINIYLQAFEMGNDVTRDVCNTLHAVIGLLEETVKGMQFYNRILQSTTIQATSTLVSSSYETVEKAREIILFQRKKVKQVIDITQIELKSMDPHASYSKEEIFEVCDRTKRKVVEQTEKVQWLNNDLKFDHSFLKVTVSHSCKEREELIDVLFKDVVKAKEFLESPMGDGNSIYNSSSEPLGSATYYMQLMKQCFIIKQSLEKLQYEYV